MFRVLLRSALVAIVTVGSASSARAGAEAAKAGPSASAPAPAATAPATTATAQTPSAPSPDVSAQAKSASPPNPGPAAAIVHPLGESSSTALSARSAPAGIQASNKAVLSGADATVARILERMQGKFERAEHEPVRMSLMEAVRAAIENNPGIRARADVPRSAAWAPYGAEGAFDPALGLGATGSRTRVPSASALASGKQTVQEDAVRGSASISKLLRSGGDLGLAWTSQDVDTNSVFYVINPRYDNRLTLSLRQPLLRNFWASRETTTVLVAKSEAEESLASFEAELSDFVASVIEAYWNYVQAGAELEVSRRSVALARELVRDAQAKVDVGLLAPVAVKEAEADAAAREERAIVIENALVVAGRDLQYKVMLGAATYDAPSPIVPVEEHVVTPVELSRSEILKTAAECRAEIRGASYALGRSRLVEKDAKNQTLPSLDLVAHYGVVGLRGDARPIDDGTGNIQYSPYNGGYGSSLDDMFGGDYTDYAVGLEFTMPLANATARARLASAEIDTRRASRDLEQTVSTVALDVDRAIADVDSAGKRVVAAKAARILAEENMRNQQRRFELGAVTTKDVLDFQEKLAIAMAAEVRSITDHALSVTRLRKAEGTLLARFGVEIERPGAPGQPWWYAF
jgi:HAE1 family hydrophobic/amphiphilic exporter-1